MARFVLVNAASNPLQVLVNVDRVVRVSPSGGNSMLFLDDGTGELDRLEVRELIPELHRMLNGAPAAPDEEWGPDSAAQLLERGPA